MVWKRAGLGALCVGALIVVVGCGGSSSSSSNGTTQSTVTVSYQKGLWVNAPEFLARDKGFFKKRGLDVKSVPVEHSGAATAAMFSGKLDFAFCQNVAAFAAVAQGLGALMVAPGIGYVKDSQDILVKKDGPIKTVKDLEGKTFGDNSAKGVTDLMLGGYMRQHGADYSKVKVALVPFAQQVDAIATGKIDFAEIQEPFLTPALKSGKFRSLGNPVIGIGPYGTPVAAYCTSTKFAEAHPDVVKKFAAAMSEANALATKDPTTIREVLPEATGLPASETKKIALGTFPATFSVSNLQKQVDLAASLGLIDKTFDVKTKLLAPGAATTP